MPRDARYSKPRPALHCTVLRPVEFNEHDPRVINRPCWKFHYDKLESLSCFSVKLLTKYEVTELQTQPAKYSTLPAQGKN